MLVEPVGSPALAFSGSSNSVQVTPGAVVEEAVVALPTTRVALMLNGLVPGVPLLGAYRRLRICDCGRLAIGW